MSLSKKISLNKHELKDFIICWLLTFVSRIVYVIAWTVMLVHVVNYFHLEFLPWFFIAFGFLAILGFFVFKNFVSFKNRFLTIIGLSFLCATCFLFASIFYVTSFWLSIFLIVFALSVFWSQLKISKMLFYESLFSPSQSTRIFPLIESAETFGTIFSGLVIALLSTYFDLSVLVAICAILVVLNIPIIFLFNDISVSTPAKILAESNVRKKIKLGDILKYRGLILLSIVVFFQFAYFYILEFQFLDFVNNLSHTVGEKNSHDLAADLGFFHMVIGFVTMIYQLFFASRIVKSIGIIKSLLLSPVVMIFSIINIIINPTFLNFLFLKTNHDITDVTFLNTYHASFYSFKHSARGLIMEFLEGFVKPLGMIFSSFVIIAFFQLIKFNAAINIFSLVILSMVAYSIVLFKKSYDESSKNALLKSSDLSSKLNALSVINQNSDNIDFDFLSEYLSLHPNIDIDLQEEFFKLYSKHGGLNEINFLLKHLNDKHLSNEFIFTSISSIIQSHHSELIKQPFTYYDITKTIQSLESSLQNKKILLELYVLELILFSSKERIESNLTKISEFMDEKLFARSYNVFKTISDKSILKFIDSLKFNLSSVFYEIVDLHMHYNDYSLDYLIIKNLSKGNASSKINALLLIINYNRYDLLEKVNPCNLSVEYKLLRSLLFDEKFEFTTNSLDLSLMSEIFSKLKDDLIKIRLSSLIQHSFKLNNDDTNYNRESLLELLKVYNMMGARKEYFLVKDMLM